MSMNRLTPAESLRVMFLLRDASEKLGFIDLLSVSDGLPRDELSKFVGDEILRVIQEQKDAEARFHQLVKERSTVRGLSNKVRFLQIQKEVKEATERLNEANYHLCRNLKDRPNIDENLNKFRRERENIMDLVVQMHEELRTEGTFASLTNMVNEMHRQENALVEAKRQEAIKKIEIQQQLKRKEVLAADFEQELREANAKILVKREEVQKARVLNALDLSFRRSSLSAKESATARQLAQKEKNLEEELAALQQSCFREKQASDTVEQVRIAQNDEMDEGFKKLAEEKQRDAIDAQLQKLRDRLEVQRQKNNALRAECEAAHQQIAEEEVKESRRLMVDKLQKEQEEKVNSAVQMLQSIGRLYIQHKLLNGGGKKKKKKKQQKK